MKIVIDPGHGGKDPGAVGITGQKEKEINLAVSLLLREMLEEYNEEIFLTRASDLDLDLQKRASFANQLGADLLLSIHCNSHTTQLAQGIEIWHSYLGEFGDVHYHRAKSIAGQIQNELILATGLWDRGIKIKLIEDKTSPFYGLDYFFMLRKTNCPALIIELGFLSNPKEEALLTNPGFQKKLAQAIVTGLVKSLNLQVKNAKTPDENCLKLIPTNIIFKNKQFKGFILEGRSFVEVRNFAEFLGLKVHWVPDKNQILIESGQ